MLAKERKEYISLARKPEIMEKTIAAEVASPKPSYPSIYLDSNPMKFAEEDVGEELTLTFKVRIARVSKTIDADKTRENCDLELLAVKRG